VIASRDLAGTDCPLNLAKVCSSKRSIAMSADKRRLAAILAADVVGYSGMVAADEPATLARVRALRAEIVEPVAAAHDGRLFKTMGDGFLLEFASAVQALRCAISIQTELNAQAERLTPAHRRASG